MDGPAGCKLSDFGRPRLRKCPFDIGSIAWKDAKVLGSGLDGWVWRVNFGDEGPFALKLFWIAEPPVDEPDNFAVQRECQNVAHLQMMQAAVEEANKEGGSRPVLLFPDPKTYEDARDNLFRFAQENRLNPPSPELQELDRLVSLTSIPPITKCYGWLKFNTDKILPRIPPRLRPQPVAVEKVARHIERGKEYIAIVYEYIEDGPNDPAKVEAFLKFMYLAGFCAASSPHGRNWKNSMLVDFSDMIGTASWGWHESRYRTFPASFFLRT
ncbi:Six-bladed beta-propeller, TolB-like protein [Pleurostoma richardsiae]|uniref:Six-bladed beta-propeller, TolB-like protein n=1 Tax=Pleurostoma richardsiae TaxID=41990 RepID=A0AA38VKC3_9PEZI|nr:Six-bladed beta-propeller, TolB-like protein [Pleurostoma richardsiae]